MSATKPSGIPWLGEVPAHWEVKRIKSVVVRSENGAWGEDEAGDENDVFCYRAADFDTDRMLVTAEKLVRRNVPPEVFRRKAVRPEHLLIEKSGGGENVPVGRVVRSLLHEPAVFSNFLGLIEVDEAQADSNYMRYTFWHLYSGKVPWRSIKQTTGLQNLDTSSYFDERIALPPLPEQRAIAAFLDERTARIDALVARKRRLVQLLKEKRQALITRAVTRGLDPKVKMKESGVPWLGEVPEHWSLPALNSRYEILLGKMLDEKRLTKTDLVPYLRNIDVQWDRVNTEDLHEMDIAPSEYERFTLRPGDLLVCEGGDIGRTATWRGELALCAFQKAVHRVRPRSASEHPRYLFYTMVAVHGRGVFLAEGNPNTIPHLTGEKFRRYRFPQPPHEEQVAIAEHLDQMTTRIDALVTKVEAAVERLQEYRTALISAAVTGKVQIPIR
ncbi:MAG: restriction endonuclease subunit S [Flavobacteriales bacterium]|nr:MAG: restriction endonuclease subunit S [Flavobacteriales bacterium]